jgi:hypothetical protein
MTDGFDGTVTRLGDGEGSSWTTWIEPPLDNRWSDLEKLRWWAAVVSHDTGLSITVSESRKTRVTQGRTHVIRAAGDYMVDIGRKSVANTGSFARTWDHLTGILRGAEAIGFQDQQDRMPWSSLRDELHTLIDTWRDSAKRRNARAHGSAKGTEVVRNSSAAAVYGMVAAQLEVTVHDIGNTTDHVARIDVADVSVGDEVAVYVPYDGRYELIKSGKITKIDGPDNDGQALVKLDTDPEDTGDVEQAGTLIGGGPGNCIIGPVLPVS